MISGFEAISSTDAETLILGSIPSVASLEKGEYYGHPRNAFWWIMGHILGFDPSASYPERAARLEKRKIALWDVLRRCERQGSLDSAIVAETVEVNDFKNFFKECPRITRVFFNGAVAEREFKKRVLREIEKAFPDIRYARLPSTSPAMASLSRERKLQIWRDAILGHARTVGHHGRGALP
jgi:hypoxanthine-DNA glycosylase